MAKTIGKAGLELVKSFEGKYNRAYKDPIGIWTIGYGHTGTVDGKKISSGMTITDKKCDELLTKDLQQHANYVDKYATGALKLNDNQRDALISFCFNCGPGNLQALVKGRTAKVVAEKILLYNKAGGKELAGLTRRRKAEQKLFNTPVKTTTTATKKSKYNFSDCDYKSYTQKKFRQDLQILFGCKTTNGSYTAELLNKTITLSTTKNKDHKAVKFVQKYMKHMGWYSGTITKIYDNHMVTCVKKLQKTFTKDVHGIMHAGKGTWSKLLK